MNECARCGSTERYRNGRCAPCTRASNQRWKQANRDRHRAGSARWQQENPESRRKTTREWGRAHRVEVSAYKREWRKRNPERHAMHEQARRALKAGGTGSYTAKEFLSLCAAYEDKCLRCGSNGPLTVDHVVPLSRGGSNSIDNIQPLCGPCNSAKGTEEHDYRIDWMSGKELNESIPPLFTDYIGWQLLEHLDAGVAA